MESNMTTEEITREIQKLNPAKEPNRTKIILVEMLKRIVSLEKQVNRGQNILDKLKDRFIKALPKMREAAKKHGYAIAIQGSMERDFDIVVIPWTNDATDTYSVAYAIREAAGSDRGDVHIREEMDRMAVNGGLLIGKILRVKTEDMLT